MKLRYWLVIGLFSFCTVSISAQNVPDGMKAGSVEKELEREVGPRAVRAPEKDILKLDVAPEQEELDMPDQEKIMVKGFNFQGNTIFSDQELNKCVAKYIDKELSLADLNKAAREVTKKYREAGYFLAVAYLPEQQIVDGVVTIEVQEGYLGEIKVEGEAHYSKDFIRSHFDPLSHGALNYNQLVKTLLLLNEYSDLYVRAILEKGSKPGTANVVLKVVDKLPVHAFASFNNAGSKYISTLRENAGVSIGNLLVDGSELSLKGTVGNPVNQLQFIDLDYNLPLNSYSTKVGAEYSESWYRLGKEFQNLRYAGNSFVIKGYLDQPLQRTRTLSTDMSLSFDWIRSLNKTQDETTSKDKLRVLRLTYTFNRGDDLFMGGRNLISFELSQGLNICGASKLTDQDLSRANADGKFTKLEIDFQRLQRISYLVSAYLHCAAQWASNPLLSYEQFGIGGIGSVRGYPPSEYMGDNGASVTLELRTAVPGLANKQFFGFKRSWGQSLQLVGFFDGGYTYLKQPAAYTAKEQKISGAGFGMRLSFPWNIYINMDYGYPVGQEPSTGSRKGVFYFTGGTSF